MKKVLVTGASGTIGSKVIKYLLSEGKYEITALDLRNKNNQKRLKKYRRRINIIYGDINDTVLIEALIKDQDFVIHLAGVMPPLADIKKNIGNILEYNGTANIIKAINFYNPDCHLLYASSTTIYGDVKEVNVNTRPKITNLDYYSNTKLKTEKMIKEKLKNYTIFRIPFVLCNPKDGAFMYNVKRNTYLEAITDNDCAYSLVGAISKAKDINNKIYNVSGGKDLRINYNELLAKVLDIYGLSFKYLLNLLFIDKNFYCHIYEDGEELAKITQYQSDSLASYYMRLKRSNKGRNIARLFAKPFIYILRRRKK